MRTFLAAAAAVAISAATAADPAARPPWEGQYKIRPDQKARLTGADVVGPDGLVYPNWAQCGVPGGIPKVAVAARIDQFGGKADDGADDSAALDRACRAVGTQGGGAVLLGKGTYHLDRPVTVRQDGVVIRGAGRDRTKIVFRYAIGKAGVAFYSPTSGARIGPGTPIELHGSPAGLTKMTISAAGKAVKTWARSTHSGNTFNVSTTGRAVIGKLPDGPAKLTGLAEYRDGSKRRCEIPVVIDSKHADGTPVPYSTAAICFRGRGPVGPKLPLAADGKRGDTKLTLRSTEGLRAGDRILLDGPATPRWKTLTKNACQWGSYRQYQLRVGRVEGRTIHVNQPLRLEFPTIDGSYVREIQPIRRCGVEGLTIEQTENLWITSVLFLNAWECWARDVKVRMCGRHPVYALQAKWCEIRDCVFDDAHFKGGGGTAYVGWEHSCDCLMENVETFRFRHAPLFQWAASGCVIRKGVFHESDAQWHSGWTNENLIEQCVVTSVRGHGGYGYGMWASPPADTAHGPNGPRNVVYNCDIASQRAGLWMGGMNENWMILHNRFVVDRGPGVFARTASFDHILRGNVFVLKDATSPMVQLATPDCIGVEVIDNRLVGGGGKVLGGAATAAVVRGNKTEPRGKDTPGRPTPAVPSIYEWQKSRSAHGQD
jgi:hypothetical protein